MTSQILVAILGAALGGFVQGLSGFAFSLVAMSVWAWFLDPKLASAMAIFGALSGQIISALSVRRGFDLSRLWPFLTGGVAGIPIGVLILPYLDADLFKMVLGIVLIIWCPVMLAVRKLPPITSGGRFADAFFGLLGGISGGVGGFTGAIPTLWLSLRRTDKDTQRSIIQNFNFATLTIAMGVNLASGAVTVSMLPMFGIVALAILLPSHLGARVYVGVSDATFRSIVLSCLTMSGVALLLFSVPRLLQAN